MAVLRVPALRLPEIRMCQEECRASGRGWPPLHHHTGLKSPGKVSPGILKASQDNSFVFRNLQQLKSWRKALNLIGLRQVTYAKTRHFHGLVFRKPCQEIRELTSGDVQDLNEQEKIENMFYIPQDFAANESVTPVDFSLENFLDSLDRDIVVSDFHELPSIDF